MPGAIDLSSEICCHVFEKFIIMKLNIDWVFRSTQPECISREEILTA